MGLTTLHTPCADSLLKSTTKLVAYGTNNPPHTWCRFRASCPSLVQGRRSGGPWHQTGAAQRGRDLRWAASGECGWLGMHRPPGGIGLHSRNKDKTQKQ